MKYTILLTQECTLRCRYCYITKNHSVIDRDVAEKTVEFIFRNTPKYEKIEVGFFGGEPLLEFDKLRFITGMIEEKNKIASRDVEMQVISNGTILDDIISEYLLRHNIVYAVSCDGIPRAQDANRLFPDGEKSSAVVEKNIIKAINTFPFLMVNAVFTPSTYELLPESVEYLYSLGLRKIYINADYSSKWSALDCEKVDSVFDKLAGIYLKWYENDDPAFLNIIDGKIIVLLEDGYKTNDKCRMGKAEFAFAPNGNIFPCERLLGDGSDNKHCIGNVFYPDNIKDPVCGKLCLALTQLECSKCSLKDYCANWCGCSNFLSTGFYNRTGPFICAVEKASIKAGCKVFGYLDERFG
ncbi:MAG: radical SAM protein [Bacteroidetes bacterium]|nr:radical SAM protein [Bacteroidota bacterium]